MSLPGPQFPPSQWTNTSCLPNTGRRATRGVALDFKEIEGNVLIEDFLRILRIQVEQKNPQFRRVMGFLRNSMVRLC